MLDPAAIGLIEQDLTLIHQAVTRFPEINEVILFGSRAKGNYKPGSDVDLAIKMTGTDITNRLSGVLNDELLLPYKFDVLNFAEISNSELVSHIERVGIRIF